MWSRNDGSTFTQTSLRRGVSRRSNPFLCHPCESRDLDSRLRGNDTITFKLLRLPIKPLPLLTFGSCGLTPPRNDGSIANQISILSLADFSAFYPSWQIPLPMIQWLQLWYIRSPLLQRNYYVQYRLRFHQAKAMD